MKILNAMFLKWNAGTENAFLNYAKALQKSGFEVINLIHPDSQIISKLEAENLKYIKSELLGRLGKYDLLTIFYFKFLIKKYQINIVFAHQGRLISLFKKACGKNAKLVAVNHGHNPKHSLGTDLAITLNSNVFNQLSKLGQNPKQIILLPNGINIDNEFTEKKIHHPIRIGSYGRLSFEKGYDVMIEALNILNKKGIDFSARIGGLGDEEMHLKNLIKKYSLAKKVEFIGWVENQKQFFDNIDLFVLPSRREESPLTPMEAIKYFTPVLSTANFGSLDLIKDGVNGFLVELENPQEMAEKIEFIIQNNNLLPQIASAAYKNLEQNYSFDCFQEKLRKITKDLTGL